MLHGCNAQDFMAGGAFILCYNAAFVNNIANLFAFGNLNEWQIENVIDIIQIKTVFNIVKAKVMTLGYVYVKQRWEFVGRSLLLNVFNIQETADI